MNTLQSDNLSGSRAIKKWLQFTFHKIVPLVICTIGAAIQVTTLITMYFEFPTSTTIELYRPDVITLPAISACYQYQLDLDKASSSVERTLNSSGSPYDLRFQLTVGEIDLMTPWLWDVIDYCRVAVPTESGESQEYIDCANASQVVVNINAYSKCFTFFGGMETPFHYRRNDYYDEYLVRMSVNWDALADTTIEIYIHETKEELTYANGSPWQITVNCKANNFVTLSYSTTRSRDLGPPYSDCISYPSVKNKSRHDFIKSCMAQSIYNENEAFHDRTFIRISEQVFNSTFKRGIELRKYRSQCEALYNDPECQSQLYQVHSLRSLNWVTLENNQTLIVFVYPLGFQSNVNQTQKLDFIEYFCYVASVVSLWLEVSLLSVVNFLFVHTSKFASKIAKNQTKQDEIRRMKLVFQRNEKLPINRNYSVSQKKRFMRRQMINPFDPGMYRGYKINYF